MSYTDWIVFSAWKFGDVFKKREDFCESPNFLFSALHISQCIHCCPLSRCNEFFVLAVNIDKTEYSPQKRRKLSTSLLSNVCESLTFHFEEFSFLVCIFS